MKKSPRYLSLDQHLKNIFGQKVQKIPLDAKSTCPNRDGTLSTGGCTFCDECGGGPGRTTGTLADQWRWWRERYARSPRLRNTSLFLGYLQTFSNTYGPAERLRMLMAELSGLPGLAGVCIGTRPDCLDGEKLAILKDTPWKELWLELGVQSFNNETLRRVNRHHDASASVKAVREAADAGIKTCIHLIAGLPGETMDDFLESVRTASELPIQGIKLHNCFISTGTGLEKEWKRGLFAPPGMEEYAEAAATALRLLRPDIVIHRLVAEPNAESLAAPAWATDKAGTLRLINAVMEYGNHVQGDMLPQSSAIPAPAADETPRASV